MISGPRPPPTTTSSLGLVFRLPKFGALLGWVSSGVPRCNLVPPVEESSVPRTITI
jgi:hypothetical protein